MALTVGKIKGYRDWRFPDRLTWKPAKKHFQIHPCDRLIFRLAQLLEERLGLRTRMAKQQIWLLWLRAWFGYAQNIIPCCDSQ